MPEKPANENLNEQDTNIYSNTQLEAVYEAAMDTLLAQMGRDVTLYLEPGRTSTITNPSQYDPFAGGQDRRQGNADTGSKGYTVDPIWVVYKAHVTYGPQEVLDKSTGIQFRLEVGDVQITTVYGAWDDIKQANELEVDSTKFIKKAVDPRPIGLSTPKYIISVWTKKTGKV